MTLRTSSSRWVRRLLPMAMLSLVAAAPAPTTPAVSTVHGDYVEARTASVFAGACHYNGERVTEGRSAVLAWNIAGGSFKGIDLAGVRMVAAVAGDENLAEPGRAHRSELVIDAPTDAQRTAAAGWVKAQLGERLGTIVGVKPMVITFKREAGETTVSAKGVAAMSVRAMPDAACCAQPNLVWYEPMMPVTGRRVGSTWQRSDENSAIYGTFGR